MCNHSYTQRLMQVCSSLMELGISMLEKGGKKESTENLSRKEERMKFRKEKHLKRISSNLDTLFSLFIIIPYLSIKLLGQQTTVKT